ncbi:MAG: LytTR family transcriptional regulator DNA-binding domain-containing protein [Cyclobacteriaceae bacterium]
MDKIRALIIDDESLARDLIKTFLDKDPEIALLGECSDGFEGFRQINELKPDLVFLDIMMPKLTGFEMLELLEEAPIIVFSTAYDEYAIKAFEKNAVDYLLKPYSEERFSEALNKAKSKVAAEKATDHVKGTTGLAAVLEEHYERVELISRIAVKTGSKIHIISTDNIRYFEAMDDYVKIYTTTGNFLKQNTMKYYETHLPQDDFLRIHRSYIVRIKEIARLELMGKDSHVVLLHDDTQLNVSRAGYSRLKEVLDF